jgi:hypothetical protein
MFRKGLYENRQEKAKKALKETGEKAVEHYNRFIQRKRAKTKKGKPGFKWQGANPLVIPRHYLARNRMQQQNSVMRMQLQRAQLVKKIQELREQNRSRR